MLNWSEVCAGKPHHRSAMETTDLAIRDAFVKSGYSYTEHGGFYLNGKEKSLEEKAAVARVYVQLKAENPRVSIRDLVMAARVSKVHNGLIVDVKEKAAHRREKGRCWSCEQKATNVLSSILQQL